jgi:hypothetical protein
MIELLVGDRVTINGYTITYCGVYEENGTPKKHKIKANDSKEVVITESELEALCFACTIVMGGM